LIEAAPPESECRMSTQMQPVATKHRDGVIHVWCPV
jgi:hypothetical protein